MTLTATEVWSRILDRARQEIPEQTYRTWLEPTEALEFEGHRLAPKIRGIDPEAEQGVTNVQKSIVEGEFDLDGDKVVLGKDLAIALGCGVGDHITIYSPGNIGHIIDELDRAKEEGAEQKSAAELRELIAPQELLVSGIF